jgi:hypothetical protein
MMLAYEEVYIKPSTTFQRSPSVGKEMTGEMKQSLPTQIGYVKTHACRGLLKGIVKPWAFTQLQMHTASGNKAGICSASKNKYR